MRRSLLERLWKDVAKCIHTLCGQTQKVKIGRSLVNPSSISKNILKPAPLAGLVYYWDVLRGWSTVNPGDFALENPDLIMEADVFFGGGHTLIP